MLISGCLLLIYTGIRAATLTLTYDEIYSLHHVQSGFEIYPDHYERMAANNHWLNSLFIWVISHGTTKNFFLRIPQLFAHAVFLFCTGSILLSVHRNLFALMAFLVININPYLLDFFSLARGYGLSLGCMMAALYCYFQLKTNSKYLLHVGGVLFFSACAVFSSFILLNFALVLMPLLVFQIHFSDLPRKQRISYQVLTLVSCAILLFLVVPHLIRMQKADALFFGSQEFWNGTVKSIVDRFLYEKAGTAYFTIAQPVIYGMVLIIAAGTILNLRKNGLLQFFQSAQGFIFLLLSGILLLTVAQALIFKTLYPLERTGLFMLVLFVLSLLLSINYIFSTGRKTAIISAVLCVPVLFHFLRCANFTYALDWTPAGNTDKILAVIVNDRNTRFPEQNITLNADAVAGNATQYIAEQKQLHWLTINLCWDTTAFTPANYYLVDKYTKPYRNMTGKKKIYHDEVTGNELYADH